jgi:hypothetical protein
MSASRAALPAPACLRHARQPLASLATFLQGFAAYRGQERCALRALVREAEQLRLALPLLRCFPSIDRPFAEFAAERLGRLSTTSILALQQAIGDRYPRVAIHRRDLSGERGETWYVYRDGHL